MARHPNQRSMAGKGFAPKATLKYSWWLSGSAPDQRAQFMILAKERERERLARYRAVYGDAPTAEAK
jgi:hypothetical protein